MRVPYLILLAAALSAACPSLLAQEAADSVAKAPAAVAVPHVIFKQVPVDGTLEEFSDRLVRSGLVFHGIREGRASLEGKFTGVEGAKVYAFSTCGQTWRVVVDFPAVDTWASVKKQYVFFKTSLSGKYVCEPRSVERFPSYCPEGTGREYNAFRDETAVYTSSFVVPNGGVTLSVVPVTSGAGRLFVRLEYVDELNSMLRDNEVIEDL